MRKVDDGKKEKRKKREEKNGVFSGHYVIASSLPPKWLRPNDDRWNAARSCQNGNNGCYGLTQQLLCGSFSNKGQNVDPWQQGKLKYALYAKVLPKKT